MGRVKIRLLMETCLLASINMEILKAMDSTSGLTEIILAASLKKLKRMDTGSGKNQAMILTVTTIRGSILTIRSTVRVSFIGPQEDTMLEGTCMI